MTKEYSVAVLRQSNTKPGKYMTVSVEYFDDRDDAIARYMTIPSPSRLRTHKIVLSELKLTSTIIERRLAKGVTSRQP